MHMTTERSWPENVLRPIPKWSDAADVLQTISSRHASSENLSYLLGERKCRNGDDRNYHAA